MPLGPRVDRQPGLTPIASGAGVVGYDATNARRIRATRAAAASRAILVRRANGDRSRAFTWRAAALPP